MEVQQPRADLGDPGWAVTDGTEFVAERFRLAPVG